MRTGFGLNTNLFETNVLNLAVVVVIVVNVVGDALKDLLDQRRKIILSTIAEANQREKDAQSRLAEAQVSVELARKQSQEIRIQAVKIVEQESSTIQKQFKETLQQIKEKGAQEIQLERQRAVNSIAQQVADLALTTAEKALIIGFKSEGNSQENQDALNAKYFNETFRQLQR